MTQIRKPDHKKPLYLKASIVGLCIDNLATPVHSDKIETTFVEPQSVVEPTILSGHHLVVGLSNYLRLDCDKQNFSSFSRITQPFFYRSLL